MKESKAGAGKFCPSATPRSRSVPVPLPHRGSNLRSCMAKRVPGAVWGKTVAIFVGLLLYRVVSGIWFVQSHERFLSTKWDVGCEEAESAVIADAEKLRKMYSSSCWNCRFNILMILYSNEQPLSQAGILYWLCRPHSAAATDPSMSSNKNPLCYQYGKYLGHCGCEFKTEWQSCTGTK